MPSTSIVWFRLDLRLADNFALTEAIRSSKQILAVYIYSPGGEGDWAPGAASRWWLHQSLQSLDNSLRKLGSRLIIRKGNAVKVLQALAETAEASSVFWNRRYDPSGWNCDAEIEEILRTSGLAVHTFNSSLLHEPLAVRAHSGQPYQVFTPFWNSLSASMAPDLPEAKPKAIRSPDGDFGSVSLASLALEPRIDWAKGLRETWSPGESGAQLRLKKFVREGLQEYATARDRPGEDGVSMLSPHLHFGEIGPRQIWHAIKEASLRKPDRVNATTYLKEIGWREFAHHVLLNFPSTCDRPLRDQFRRFPWVESKQALARWQKGETGYPIVDAGMRQLWHTGWMHNRVRMIVASFLTKDLLISWLHGAKWFWDTLVDADLANNTLGWQWAAGCGADAAPYFRIFNPVLQGEKFDPDGSYVRQWIPELSRMPAKYIHKPWKAPDSVLSSAGVELGRTYPHPIVDHSLARRRALAAFASIRGRSKH